MKIAQLLCWHYFAAIFAQVGHTILALSVKITAKYRTSKCIMRAIGLLFCDNYWRMIQPMFIVSVVAIYMLPSTSVHLILGRQLLHYSKDLGPVF